MKDFYAVFKSVDDVLWKDSGCSTELDYTEQTSWVLFLKYIEGLEDERQLIEEANGRDYTRFISDDYRWTSWAAPKDSLGQLDHSKVLTGDDLKVFVNDELFPYLANFKNIAEGTNTLEFKVGEIFSEIKNKIESGYSLRAVIDLIDQLEFNKKSDRHELSVLYEDKIKNMGNAGRNGGEYYTPRPLIQTIVKVINPQIGETVYDGAVGSAGFLCEAKDFMFGDGAITESQNEQLKKHTFYGKEKKSLAYIIGIMNMILHGIEIPNITHANTLADNILGIEEKDQVDVVLANPPFGGKEQTEIQENFPIKTSETAYLFLQHFIKMLKVGGRCGIVIKNSFLSNTDNASIALRKKLLEECNLHTILDLPSGAFTGTGVKTIVLFFDKGTATKNIWYYQLNVERNMGKTNPININDFKEFLDIYSAKPDSENSWTVKYDDLDKDNYDLAVENPNIVEEVDNRTPQEIIAEIEQLDAQAAQALKAIKELL